MPDAAAKLQMKSYDWNDLRYFLAIARTGSTISAAKDLGVNQSTVQRRLAALEDGVGRKLEFRQVLGCDSRWFGGRHVDPLGPRQEGDVCKHEHEESCAHGRILGVS